MFKRFDVSGRSQNLKRAVPKSGRLSCFHKNSFHWLRKRARPVFIEEKFAVHGIHNIDVGTLLKAGVSISKLHDIIGNSYNWHVVVPIAISMIVNGPWHFELCAGAAQDSSAETA